MTSIKASVAEFIGTFALMFVGGGAIIINAAMRDGGGGLIAIALAHGLILAIMVSATLHISGGQLNPSVSIALGVIRKQPWSQVAIFVAAQIIGSVCAASLLRMLLGGLHTADGSEVAIVKTQLGATLGGLGLGAGTVLVLEMIATFFLMWAVMGTAVDPRGVGKTFAVGGFGIGLTVAADILAIGPATGASMNPARSFGPAFIISVGGGDAWDMHWAYWVGPIVGATLAALLYQVAFTAPVEPVLPNK